MFLTDAEPNFSRHRFETLILKKVLFHALLAAGCVKLQTLHSVHTGA